MPMLWPCMQQTRTEHKPFAYVFVEGGRVVIRGSGPLGSRLMMAMSRGWSDIQCEESLRSGRSTWAIRLVSSEKSGKRQRIALARKKAGWLCTGAMGCAGAGYLAAGGLWAVAVAMGLASAGAWLFGATRS